MRRFDASYRRLQLHFGIFSKINLATTVSSSCLIGATSSREDACDGLTDDGRRGMSFQEKLKRPWWHKICNFLLHIPSVSSLSVLCVCHNGQWVPGPVQRGKKIREK